MSPKWSRRALQKEFHIMVKLGNSHCTTIWNCKRNFRLTVTYRGAMRIIELTSSIFAMKRARHQAAVHWGHHVFGLEGEYNRSHIPCSGQLTHWICPSRSSCSVKTTENFIILAAFPSAISSRVPVSKFWAVSRVNLLFYFEGQNRPFLTTMTACRPRSCMGRLAMTCQVEARIDSWNGAKFKDWHPR